MPRKLATKRFLGRRYSSCGVLAFGHNDGDGCVHRDVLRAFGDDDLAENAFIDRFEFHRRLVGFDLGEDLAR